jgi:hypothetical protein
MDTSKKPKSSLMKAKAARMLQIKAMQELIRKKQAESKLKE